MEGIDGVGGKLEEFGEDEGFQVVSVSFASGAFVSR